MDISAIQIVIVLVIALLVFGPSRMPELARQVGRGIREMRRQVNEMSDDVREALDKDDPEPSRPITATPTAPATTPAAVVDVEDDDDLLAGVIVSGDTAPDPRSADPAA